MNRARAARGVATAAVAIAAAACVPIGPPPPPPDGGGGGGGTAALAAAPPEISKPQPEPVLNAVDFVSPTDRPWDIAFLPGAPGPEMAMLYTENNSGKVKAYISNAMPGRELIDIADVDPTGEGGLMGIAAHPTQQWVYVCYTSSAHSDNRVVRYDLASDPTGPTGLSNPVEIVTGMENAGFHNGCRIRFQPGTTFLFVTMGDARVGSAPQNPMSLNGKVLRVNDDATLPAGNLSGRLWYTKGHRNPQGVAFRPGTNAPYDAEHGPGINDEINALSNGANAGWDPVPGYDESVPMTDLAKFPGALRPKWRSGDTRTIAISGIDFLQNLGGSDWKAWNGFLVSAELKDHELRLYRLDGAGNITGQVKIFDNGQRLRVPVLGPDGKLYVATDVDVSGRIIQISPA